VPPAAEVEELLRRAPDASPAIEAAVLAGLTPAASPAQRAALVDALPAAASRDLLAAWLLALALTCGHRRLATLALRETKRLGGRPRLDDSEFGRTMAWLQDEGIARTQTAAARYLLRERGLPETDAAIARLKRAARKHRPLAES